MFFIKSDILIGPKGYEINPTLLDLLQSKMFARDDTEDPYRHVEYFEDVCATFNLSIFTEDEVKFKLFDKLLLIKLVLGIMIILFSIPMNGKHCLLSSLTLFFSRN
jgi:hypothetical protein